MSALLAFHGETKIKQKYLRRVRDHKKADEIVQGYGYWSNGKGCAVGCTLHVDDDPHPHYETELGIPQRLAYLEDAIFEGLPVDDAREWPSRFLSAIKPGADLSIVWNHFTVWLLRDSELLMIADVNREAIGAVIALHVRMTEGKKVSESAWSAAAWSAESAARSARSAARSAAAWSAESAAWSAAESAARSAYKKMAGKLIELLQSA